jgi:hypothetical protein
MPPQQPDRLLDLFDEFLGFGAHRCLVHLTGPAAIHRMAGNTM